MGAYSFKELTRLHKAMADETRVRVLHLLVHKGELCVCDIESCLELPQSRTSRHLAYLRNAGVVEHRRDRNWVYYKLRLSDPIVAAEMETLRAALVTDPIAIADLRRHDRCCSPERCEPNTEARA